MVDLTGSINSILGSLKGMETWIPRVDAGMKKLHEEVGGIVA